MPAQERFAEIFEIQIQRQGKISEKWYSRRHYRRDICQSCRNEKPEDEKKIRSNVIHCGASIAFLCYYGKGEITIGYFMLSRYKSHMRPFTDTLVSFLPAMNPNTLTILGGILSVLFFVAVIDKLYLLALCIFLGNALDFLDGAMARRYNKVSAFGGFLDSTIDRISDFLIIAALAFGNVIRWEIAAPMLLFTFLISYTRARGEAAGREITISVGLIERTERLILLFIAFLLYVFFPTTTITSLNLAEFVSILLLILSIYTFSQRMVYAYQVLQK